jgi:hypothetical protein
MRPLKVTSERIVAESPEGKKSVWDYTWVTVVVGMEERKPSGVWMW